MTTEKKSLEIVIEAKRREIASTQEGRDLLERLEQRILELRDQMLAELDYDTCKKAFEEQVEEAKQYAERSFREELFERHIVTYERYKAQSSLTPIIYKTDVVLDEQLTLVADLQVYARVSDCLNEDGLVITSPYLYIRNAWFKELPKSTNYVQGEDNVSGEGFEAQIKEYKKLLTGQEDGQTITSALIPFKSHLERVFMFGFHSKAIIVRPKNK